MISNDLATTNSSSTMLMPIEPALFWTLAATLVAILSTTISIKMKERRFKENFGINAEICDKLWVLCLPLLPESASPVHLLWALYFLKQYNTEGVNASFAKNAMKRNPGSGVGS
jgi:hypothetical protein